MPWREVTAMSEKKRFIQLAKQPKSNISLLCREVGISRKTAYKYLNQYNIEGEAGLKNRSRKAHYCPHKTDKRVEELLIETRNLFPTWGGEKIKQFLLDNGYAQLPSEKTIDRIFKRHGLIAEEESQKRKGWVRFVHENPNDLWQMDFKGHFELGEGRCHALTILDDHSRFVLPIKACSDERSDTVKSHLIRVFHENGIPKRMTMDNGSPWGYSRTQMHTRLTAWLIQIGIKVSHSRPNHPQTQGKLERFHRTLKLELLSQYFFESLAEAQEGLDWWRRIYNEERPHAALNLETPAKRYKISERAYPEVLPKIEYGEGYEVRKVQQKGFISFKGKEYKISDAFCGLPVGLKVSEEDHIYDVYFCHQKVNKIDLRR
jgi:transposase InsO family protein